MTLQEITAKMKEGASKKSSFGNTVKFTTDQGVVYIDGNANLRVDTVCARDCAAEADLLLHRCHRVERDIEPALLLGTA